MKNVSADSLITGNKYWITFYDLNHILTVCLTFKTRVEDKMFFLTRDDVQVEISQKEIIEYKPA